MTYSCQRDIVTYVRDTGRPPSPAWVWLGRRLGLYHNPPVVHLMAGTQTQKDFAAYAQTPEVVRRHLSGQ